MATETLTKQDYKVRDINLADFGRKEVEIAQHEIRLDRDDLQR